MLPLATRGLHRPRWSIAGILREGEGDPHPSCIRSTLARELDGISNLREEETELAQKSGTDRQHVPIVGVEPVLTRHAISPTEVIGYVSFPRGLVLSDSTKRAFAAREHAVR